MARPIIIDTDPGIDDALAILLALASPELDVLAIVAVAGNVPLALTSRNARQIVELAGRPELPVYAGCPCPIGPNRIDAGHVHGDTGLGDLVLPPPANPPCPEHGVIYLVERLRGAAERSMTLCALGPLTNIAAALTMMPEISRAVAELVLMGGGSHGNITPAAEFNMYADPYAAAAVFASGLPITMVPLDVTETVRSTAERIRPIADLRTGCGRAAATLLAAAEQAGRPPMPLHDPCVVAYLLRPDLFQVRNVNVAIETQSPLTIGMTVIDRRGRSGRASNVQLVESIDADGVYRLLAERFATLP